MFEHILSQIIKKFWNPLFNPYYEIRIKYEHLRDRCRIVSFTKRKKKKRNLDLIDKEEDPESPRVLRHIELIDDEAAEYGIKIVRMKDRLMAKKYGFRNPPGITYFRKGKNINYDGDIDDEEEILDWLTNPENMELTDHIERINKKMFHKIRQTTDYLAVFFCEYSSIFKKEFLRKFQNRYYRMAKIESRQLIN